MEKTDRDAVIEHATQVKHLVHDPNSFLTELLIQQQQYYCIGWLCHFDVLSCIPQPPESIAYAEVAAKAKVPLSKLQSVARMAMTTGFLRETKDGKISHTALSAPFVTDFHMKTQLFHIFNQTVPLMAGLTQATEKWGDTSATNETAYNIVHNTDLSFFQHLKTHSDLNEGFQAYMKSRAVSHTGSNVEHLIDAFDWKSLGQARVVDIGGSSGSTSIMLATAFPGLKLVVEDLPEPITNARSRVPELSEDVKSRIEIIEYDFFTPQPVKHADVYLLRTILHDWPDADAVKILQGVVEAMGPSSRLLVMDMVLPKPGSGSKTFEATLRQKDLTMIQAFNAKEREVEEWSALLAKADPRLKVRAIERPAGSELSVIEATLEEEAANDSAWYALGN
ncbi:fusarubin cluster-methyltransferase [Fusarium torreyae]|uniref:Fusarubin cluster-methyltransferase n=1 Tax=Fusarium torreyae TaxID=1237075 RepID=A0A9W8S8C1_9HYPO|nr:fusarubin cluster-methyltransferase [Fusarium torreyae]